MIITNIILIFIAIVSVGVFLKLSKIAKKILSFRADNLKEDISLVEEVINYIASKGKEPIIGGDDRNIQYFSFINEKHEIINITPIEDISYNRNTSDWKRRRAELFKIVDDFLDENN